MHSYVGHTTNISKDGFRKGAYEKLSAKNGDKWSGRQDCFVGT